MKSVETSDSTELKWKICLGLATVFFCISFGVMLVSLGRPSKGFIAPKFDPNAQTEELPEIDSELNWTVVSSTDLPFVTGMSGTPRLVAEGLEVYFTNLAENEDWLMLRVVNEEGTVLGETGLLKPGEYIRYVPGYFSIGTDLGFKVMAYKPNLYYSDGSATLWTSAHI